MRYIVNMKNQAKLCKKCGKEFFKQPSHSSKYWEGREFCSVSCSTIGRAGYWKGKSNPHMIGNTLREGLSSWNKGLTIENNEIVKAYGKKSGDSRKNIPKIPFRMIGGYKHIMAPDHPRANCVKTVAEHILIMEKHIGRYLNNEEVVHHINEIKTDNRIGNLKIFANSAEHMRYHAMNSPDNGLYKCHINGRIHSQETRKKISETLKQRNKPRCGQ